MLDACQVASRLTVENYEEPVRSINSQGALGDGTAGYLLDLGLPVKPGATARERWVSVRNSCGELARDFDNDERWVGPIELMGLTWLSWLSILLELVGGAVLWRAASLNGGGKFSEIDKPLWASVLQSVSNACTQTKSGRIGMYLVCVGLVLQLL